MIKKTGFLVSAFMTCTLVFAFFLLGSCGAAATEGGEEIFVLVNDYFSSGSYTWEFSKKIEGRAFREGEKFVFDLEAVDGAPLPLDADGQPLSSCTLEIQPDEAGSYTVSRSLPAFHYTNADLGPELSRTFTYRLTERAGSETWMTSDTQPKTLKLRAADRKDGTIEVTRVTEDGEGNTVFTNIYSRSSSAAVEKIWDDADNQDGKRPDTLLVELHRTVTRTLGVSPDGRTADEIVLEDIPLSGSNGWSYREDDLPCWDQWGNEYTYEWKEYTRTGDRKVYPSENGKILTFSGADYTCEAVTEESTEEETPLTETALTNRHAPELTELTVRKIWQDQNDGQGKRPKSITVMLYANNRPTGLAVRLGGDQAFLNSGAGDTYRAVAFEPGTSEGETDPFAATLRNLPVYIAGVRQVYAWVESDTATDRDGNEKSLSEDLLYTTARSIVSGNTTTITNRHDPGKISLTLLKIWDDAEDRNGFRPESVRVTLRAVNGNYERAYTLDAGNGWRILATDLPRTQGGQVLEYEWTENSVPYGYVMTDAEGNPAEAVSADAAGGKIAVIVNRYDMVTTTVTVRKVWEDADNQDGLRPERIVMTLSNGTKAELNEGNRWTASIRNLPVYDAAGRTITYTWTEPAIRDYQQQSVIRNGYETTFVNAHTPETTSTKVVKIWDDGDNAAGLRPANLRVTLSNGTTYYLNEGNGWTVTVSGLPAYRQGEPILYTWSEQSVLGYTSTTEIRENTTLFTNHFDGEYDPEDGGKKKLRLPDRSLVTIEDLFTPLGLGGIINHVGDTFE